MKPTPLVQKLYELAKDAGLSYPLGRAYYAANRTYNGGLGRYFGPWPIHQANTDERLQAQYNCMLMCRPDTAKRWIKHIKNGGSLKSMNRSVAQESQRRSQRRIEMLERMRQYGS